MFSQNFSLREPESASEGHVPPLKAWNRALLVAGLVGFGISLYALILHLQSKATGGAELGCDVGDLVNCTNVLAGEYGEFLSIPLGGYGMAFFAILMGVAFLPMNSAASSSWHARLQLAVTGVGALTSVLLAYLSYFVIGSICYVCSAVHLTCIVAFLIVLRSWFKVRDEKPQSDGRAFMKFISVSLAVSVPALLAGLITPHLAPQLLGKAGGGTDEAPQLDMASTPIPETLLSVSKSRFVGKGEDYRKGAEDAPVVIQMFSDFQCPHCATTNRAIETAIKNVGEDKVLYVYRNYPLSSVCNKNIGSTGHTHACQLAHAARCGGQQGRFWDMKAWAFGLMGASKDELEQATSETALMQKANELGLNAETFKACMSAEGELNKIRDDIRIANELGIKGTPFIVVNNRVYEGARSPEALSNLFRSLAALAESN